MKLILAITLALFTVALCDFSFRPNGAQVTDLQDHRKIDDLQYFFLTLYKQFNLSEPTEIVQCFNEKTAGLFFDSIYEFHQLLNDTKERNSIRLHIDYAKLVVLYHSLKETHECVYRTQDFKRLLEALEVEVKNPEELMLVKYIYYQARFAALLNDFIPVINGLEDNNNRKAGIAYARVISNMVETIKYRGMYFLGSQAFENGFAEKLDMKNPVDSWRCWDNESSQAYLEFLLRLSEEISNGKWIESPDNTRLFWRDFGKEILKRVPKETWECFAKSQDSHELFHVLGMNIYDEEFLDLLLKWINNNRLKYYLMMKGIKESFDHYNLNHAGGIFAKLIRDVAKTNPDDVDVDYQDIEV